jgi:hypothetical protein
MRYDHFALTFDFNIQDQEVNGQKPKAKSQRLMVNV